MRKTLHLVHTAIHRPNHHQHAQAGQARRHSGRHRHGLAHHIQQPVLHQRLRYEQLAALLHPMQQHRGGSRIHQLGQPTAPSATASPAARNIRHKNAALRLRKQLEQFSACPRMAHQNHRHLALQQPLKIVHRQRRIAAHLQRRLCADNGNTEQANLNSCQGLANR